MPQFNIYFFLWVLIFLLNCILLYGTCFLSTRFADWLKIVPFKVLKCIIYCTCISVKIKRFLSITSIKLQYSQKCFPLLLKKTDIQPETKCYHGFSEVQNAAFVVNRKRRIFFLTRCPWGKQTIANNRNGMLVDKMYYEPGTTVLHFFLSSHSDIDQLFSFNISPNERK